MNTTLILAKYIASNTFKKFVVGQQDCMTFATRWHDERFGTTRTNSVAGKYNSPRSALKFYRNYISVSAWFTMCGYSVIEDVEVFKDGDFVETMQVGMPLAWIVLNDNCYTIDETGMQCVKGSAFRESNHTHTLKVWRQ